MHDDWSSSDYVVVNLARQIRPREIVFSGVNSFLPMLACFVAKQAYDYSFTYLNVAGGVDGTPNRLPRSSGDGSLVAGSAAVFENEDFYDLCARGGLDLVFLGAAQIDGRGRTNVSAIGGWKHPKVRLPGGGGAAVMMPTAKRVVVWRTEHSPRTLVENLDFVTAAGNVGTLVTPLGVFQIRDGRFALESHHPRSDVEQIVERTGFEFSADDAVPAEPMTASERAAIRELDLEGYAADEVPGRR